MHVQSSLEHLKVSLPLKLTGDQHTRELKFLRTCFGKLSQEILFRKSSFIETSLLTWS